MRLRLGSPLSPDLQSLQTPVSSLASIWAAYLWVYIRLNHFSHTLMIGIVISPPSLTSLDNGKHFGWLNFWPRAKAHWLSPISVCGPPREVDGLARDVLGRTPA